MPRLKRVVPPKRRQYALWQTWIVEVQERKPAFRPWNGFLRQPAQATGTGSISSLDAFFGRPTLAGSLLIVSVRGSDTDTIQAPTDDAGNTYTNIPGASIVDAGNEQISTWYVENAAAGVTFIRAHWLAAGTARQLFVGEVVGIASSASLDQANAAVATFGTTATSGNVTTTSAQEFLWAAFVTSGNHGAITSVGAGWQLEASQQSDAALPTGGAQDEVVTATGTYSAAFNFATSSSWSCAIATFKAAPPAAPPTAPVPHALVALNAIRRGSYDPR